MCAHAQPNTYTRIHTYIHHSQSHTCMHTHTRTYIHTYLKFFCRHIHFEIMYLACCFTRRFVAHRPITLPRLPASHVNLAICLSIYRATYSDTHTHKHKCIYVCMYIRTCSISFLAIPFLNVLLLPHSFCHIADPVHFV